MLLAFCKKLVQVGKELEVTILWQILVILYNKNILEYAQILVTGGKFMIFEIKGHPTIFRPIVWRDQIADQIGFPKGPIRW